MGEDGIETRGEIIGETPQNNNNGDTTKHTSEVCEYILDYQEKLTFAKNILSQEQYNAIGVKWIVNKGMTKEKLNVLGDNDLVIEQIIAIGGEFLAHEKMTDSKITVIGYELSPEDIKRIGPEILANISIATLNLIV